jgi:hypothetical protein
MADKSFEKTIPFVEVQGVGWYPLIKVTFLKPNKHKLSLPLLSDTGAEIICLHPDWQHLFPGLQDTSFYGVGQDTAAQGKTTNSQIEFLGRTMDCELGFAPMRSRTWMAGVVGRECFKCFGFGFWGSARELYVTLKP